MDVCVFEVCQLVGVGAVVALAAVCDLRVRVIPNRMVLAVGALWMVGVAVHAFLAGDGGDICALLVWSCAGALCALVPLVAAGLLVGGVGGGDIKLLGSLGLVLGPAATCVLLMLSCLLEVAFALLRHAVLHGGTSLREHNPSPLRHALPFAPFIALTYPLAAIIRCSC